MPSYDPKNPNFGLPAHMRPAIEQMETPPREATMAFLSSHIGPAVAAKTISLTRVAEALQAPTVIDHYNAARETADSQPALSKSDQIWRGSFTKLYQEVAKRKPATHFVQLSALTQLSRRLFNDQLDHMLTLREETAGLWDIRLIRHTMLPHDFSANLAATVNPTGERDIYLEAEETENVNPDNTIVPIVARRITQQSYYPAGSADAQKYGAYFDTLDSTALSATETDHTFKRMLYS